MSIKYSIPAEKREELSQLSKLVYGASSKWLKLMERGRLEIDTREVTEEVPSEVEGEAPTTRKVKVPVTLDAAGKSYSKSYRKLTLEEVEADMRARKEAFDKFKAAMQAQADAAKAAKEQAELEAKVAQQFTGSAV